MPSTVPALLLTQNGEVKSAKVTVQSDTVGCQLSDVQKYLKKKIVPQILGTYPWKNQTLHLIGYKDGKAGTENQHELPPPHDKDLYFGDIIVFLSKEKKSFAHPLPMKSEEYENFYTQMFEGFEDLDESGSEEEEEDDYEEEEDLSEGEFEENEEQEEFSDDNDDQRSLEEFDGNVKKEEEEEVFPEVIIKKKAQTKAGAKGKGKAVKETPSTVLPSHMTELKPEEKFTSSTPNQPNRLKIFQVIQKILGGFLNVNQQLELEHHIYNGSLQVAHKKHILKNWSHPLYIEVYNALARSVIGNLNPNSYIQNKNLFQRFQEGKVTLEELAHFTFSDLYPEIWKDLSIRQFEREKRQLEGNKSMATDQFECKRCHKRECTYYELQTRSADEPMTIFIQCVNCGKHWRQ